MGVVRPLNRDLIQSGLPAAKAQQHEADTRCSTATGAVNPAKIRLPDPGAARLCGRCQDGGCPCQVSPFAFGLPPGFSDPRRPDRLVTRSWYVWTLLTVLSDIWAIGHKGMSGGL
jgi:hypothetical protein